MVSGSLSNLQLLDSRSCPFTFLKHYKGKIAHTPAYKTSQTRSPQLPSGGSTTYGHWGNFGVEGNVPGPELLGPWNHPTTYPPASANQVSSDNIMQISLRTPASQELGLPPPSVLFHPSHAEPTGASLATGAQPIFRYKRLKREREKEKKKGRGGGK